MLARRNGPGRRGALWLLALTAIALIDLVDAKPQSIRGASSQSQALSQSRPSRRDGSSDHEDEVPLHISNRCEDMIWPAIVTQAGTGPGTGGFEQESGNTTKLWVSSDWQGRIWGRTNCTGSEDDFSCKTGDCRGALSCEYSGETPATLAEFTLNGGTNNDLTYYDISLVDGYNLPVGINHIATENTTFIPPNLSNCACIATKGWLSDSSETGDVYSNDSFPIPWEDSETNSAVGRWCPWPLLESPPDKPGQGVFPYPDDNIKRPFFSPCLSACAATGSNKDCCAGKYNDPDKCKPSLYSKSAKAVCPDAYSFAYDDDTSTFIVPSGGGWEVVLCPEGRSTTILQQLGTELNELAFQGQLSNDSLAKIQNVTYITMDKGEGAGLRPSVTAVAGAVLGLAAWAVW